MIYNMFEHKMTIKVILLILAYTGTYALEKIRSEPTIPLGNSIISHERFGEELLQASKQLLPIPIPKHCPNETLVPILPCVCSYGNVIHTEIDLDCSQVSNEIELENILKGIIPSRHFRLLNMTGSPITTLHNSVFGNHRFDKVDFSHSALEAVEEDVFEHSKKTLTIVDMTGAPLSTFPFTSIDKFSSLSQFLVNENQYSSIPPLVNSNLRDLVVGSPNLKQLPEFTSGSLPNLQILDVQHSPLNTLTPGQFVNLESLQWLVLHDVGLTTLETDTFKLNDNLLDGNHTFFIHIEENKIQEIQPDAIHSTGDTWVFLRGNSLAILEQDVWQPLLESGTLVDVFGLPVECDCSLAWVVNNKDYIYQLFNGVCVDGRLFEDLDPSDYSEC